MTSSRLRVASDVGGTFTDSLAYDEAAKRVAVAKVPTTLENRGEGMVEEASGKANVILGASDIVAAETPGSGWGAA